MGTTKVEQGHGRGRAKIQKRNHRVQQGHNGGLAGVQQGYNRGTGEMKQRHDRGMTRAQQGCIRGIARVHRGASSVRLGYIGIAELYPGLAGVHREFSWGTARVQQGNSRGIAGVQQRYRRGTPRAQQGFIKGASGVHWGYSRVQQAPIWASPLQKMKALHTLCKTVR